MVGGAGLKWGVGSWAPEREEREIKGVRPSVPSAALLLSEHQRLRITFILLARRERKRERDNNRRMDGGKGVRSGRKQQKGKGKDVEGAGQHENQEVVSSFSASLSPKKIQ